MKAIISLGFVLALAAPAAAQEPPYASPMKDQCNQEIEKDERWYNDLRQLFTNQLFFEAREPVPASPPARLPSHETGYVSAMRAQCEAEMRRDGKWMAELRAHYDALLSFEFQDRNAGAWATNQKHVILGYAAFLVLLIGFCVALFLRQRSLSAEIERLRDDVKRAAAE